MPTEKDHVRLANRTHDALELLLGDAKNHSEWVVVVAFYKALHVVSAVSKKQGRVSTNHISRNDWLKNNQPDIWKHYRPLWQASLVARYLHCDGKGGSKYSCFDDYCPPGDVAKKFIRKRLKPIEDLSVGRLSSDAKGELSRVQSLTS